MTAVNDAYGFYLGQPWWLAASLVIVPMIWLAGRSLTTLGTTRRLMAVVLRVAVVLLLAVLLARPTLLQKNRRTTVIAVVDRSQSIPGELAEAALDYLTRAVVHKPTQNQFAVVDVAEEASISLLPTGDAQIRRRNTLLTGSQSRLADGVQMAMAIAPPDTAVRIVLASEGNETEGDLKEAARTAAANGIPIDVLPLRYRYGNEVLFRRVAAPPRVRSGQTIPLRFLLDSTGDVRGKLMLTLNGKPVDLMPDTPEVAVPVELKAGTNVKMVSVPVGARGIHDFEVVFLADDPRQDRIAENNRAGTITCVTAPGYVRVFDVDRGGEALARGLQQAGIDTVRDDISELPTELSRLLDVDAIVLVNTAVQHFTMAQQEMLCRYVNDLGGGLVMVGGPESFGAGGWIGSPVAAMLPVDLDPPQKKQLPMGALVLVLDHSGSMLGEKVEICKAAAAGAVRLLSRRDLVGIVLFDAASEWLVKLGPAEDKDKIYREIGGVGAGGGTIMAPAMELAFDALRGAKPTVKHVILLTDGQTAFPEDCSRLGLEMAAAGITISTVAIGSDTNMQLLNGIAAAAQGRFYPVADPTTIPEIFIKEAQVVRRSMIVEQTFSPQVVYALSEVLSGVPTALPPLDGYVLTGPKGGLNQLVLGSNEADPILATCQSGLGRCVAFTSSADTRWAAQWVQWPGFSKLWDQVVRWAGKPSQSAECEIMTDVEGQEATVRVEAFDAQGRFLQFASIEGKVLTPEMKGETLQLTQTGPGQYSGRFRARSSGSYVVNLQYRRADETAPRNEDAPSPSPEATRLANAIVTIPFAPEFRDLSDNGPLLEEVSKMTRGRVLSLDSDPNEANLFDSAGLKFPETHLPLVRPLMLAWVLLFLLDVAVRRVVIDVRAMLRRVTGWLAAAGRQQKDERIARLQAQRQKLRAQWSAQAADGASAKHYEGGEKYRGDLIDSDRKRQEPPSAQPAVEEPKPAKPVSPSTHIDQLLQVKRRKTGHEEKG
ncbi:MAG: VWA domain-containing protein [Phycisphaerae bacterium]|nr:VWA domain-containing protein [Phycisphaerae bacterium]